MGLGLTKKSLCVAWLLSIFSVKCNLAFTVDDEINLKAKLLSNTGIVTVRPEQVTRVELSFNLLTINNVDIKNEQFSIAGWWSMKWNDSRLSWTGTQYNIPVIQVYNTDIWTPALVVDNSVDDLSAIEETTIPLRISKDGQVTWNPPGILVTSCEMDVTYFPFDTQICSIQVTSFGYTIQELDINVHSGLSRTYYQENGEWTFIRTWNARYEYNDDDYDYAKVAFYVEIRRRAVYYGLNTMLPVLLNSLLIPLVFLLPHDAGEKIGYCLTVLLAYVVLLTIVTDGLPTTAENQSLLGVYIALVLSLAAMAVCLAIHSLYIFHHNPERPVPLWQAKLTRWSLRIVRCKSVKSSTMISPSPDDPGEEKRRQLNRLNTRTSVVLGSKKENGFSPDSINGLPSGGGEEEHMSWNMVAQAYDAFFLRVYFAIILSCSIGFLLAMASNQF